MEILEPLHEELFRMIRTRLNAWFYLATTATTIAVWDQRGDRDRNIGTFYVSLSKATINLKAYGPPHLLPTLTVALADPNCLEIVEDWIVKFTTYFAENQCTHSTR
jgi:hypothetical protein